MHKEWVRLDDERERLFWEHVDRVPHYRYIEEQQEDGTLDSYVEYYEDVRDEDDEPEVDGIYTDCDGDRWIRLNGLWCPPNAYAYDEFSPWKDNASGYVPFIPVPIEDY